LHASAPGKALIAWLPEKDLDAILARYRFTRYNDNTITNRTSLKKHLLESRRQGYATDFAEEFDGCHCLGVPIHNENGYPVATIWTTGPAKTLTARKMPGFAKRLNEAASAIALAIQERTTRDPKAYRTQKIQEAKRLLESRLPVMGFTIENAASELHVSYSWFRKAFKQETGLSPNAYLLRLKITHAQHLLRTRKQSIQEIAERLGFESANYFTIFFKGKTGFTPSQFRHRHHLRRLGGR
jgi:AraC-like DNA-binding protein